MKPLLIWRELLFGLGIVHPMRLIIPGLRLLLKIVRPLPSHPKSAVVHGIVSLLSSSSPNFYRSSGRNWIIGGNAFLGDPCSTTGCLGQSPWNSDASRFHPSFQESYASIGPQPVFFDDHLQFQLPVFGFYLHGWTNLNLSLQAAVGHKAFLLQRNG